MSGFYTTPAKSKLLTFCKASEWPREPKASLATLADPCKGDTDEAQHHM